MRELMRAAIVAGVLVLAAPHSGLAQPVTGRAGPTLVRSGLEPAGLRRQAPSYPTSRLVAGGLLGGGGGLLVGGLTGLLIGGNHCTDPGNPDSCSGIEGLVIGSMAGEMLGIPLGVHLANGRQGRVAPSIAASAAIAAAGIGMVMAVKSDRAALAVGVAVPAAQLVSSVLIERRTARRR